LNGDYRQVEITKADWGGRGEKLYTSRDPMGRSLNFDSEERGGQLARVKIRVVKSLGRRSDR